MSTRRLKIYSTATIAVSVLAIVGEALLTMPGLSLDRIKGFSAYQSVRGTSYHTSCGQNTPKITYTRASRASVRGTGEDSYGLWSQLSGGHAVPHPLTAWERATAVDASPAGTPYFTIKCLGNVATLAAPEIALLRTRTGQPHVCS